MRVIVVALVALLASWAPTASQAQSQTTLKLAPAEPLAFARATAPRAFRLPEDHGPHFEFQTEWWYYTGQLVTADERRFGFQLTFFRRGLSPGAPPAAGLATNQIYFAHFAVTDVGGGRHASAERLSRGAAGLAGASGQPFRVYVEDWTASSTRPDGAAVRVRARDSGLVLDLELRATKPLVAHGDRGLSSKSDEPGNASYYVGYTRLRTSGRITTASGTFEVTGASWFDHEWATNQLAPEQAGWNWISAQFEDGTELMLYQMRLTNGAIDPISSGTFVREDGTSVALTSADFQMTPESFWKSPGTKANYPIGWRIAVSKEQLEFIIEPVLANQELVFSPLIYWEGAFDLVGTRASEPLRGRGYLELTGYAGSLAESLNR
jgi:predicted secreted hydrolase